MALEQQGGLQNPESSPMTSSWQGLYSLQSLGPDRALEGAQHSFNVKALGFRELLALSSKSQTSMLL